MDVCDKNWILRLSSQADALLKGCLHNVIKLSEDPQCTEGIAHEEPESKSKNPCHLGDMLEEYEKLLRQMFVWPASTDLLTLEMKAVSNSLLLAVASWDPGMIVCDNKHDPMLQNITKKVLLRALNCLEETPDVLSRGLTAENLIMKLITALGDPIQHFKALSFQGNLLLLCSMWCLYRKQQGNKTETDRAVNCLVRLEAAANVDVLGEKFPVQYGFLLCTPNGEGNNSVTVGGAVNLVLRAFGRWSKHKAQNVDKWKWLLAVFECESLTDKDLCIEKMHQLQAVLEEPLHPEAKSKLLSLFAQCYWKLDFPQLAIQTYKTALTTDKENLSVLLDLSKLYSSLERHGLELECLNLLVKKLTDLEMRGLTTKAYRSLELDGILAAIFDVFLQPQLIPTLHHFAKRCFQLTRFHDATEQYLSLLNLIQKPGSFAKESHTTNQDNTNVEEIVVETAEALLADGQNQECVALCDDFLPYLTADDSLHRMNQSHNWHRINQSHNWPSETDPDDHQNSHTFHNSDNQMNNSQISLFSSPPHFQHSENAEDPSQHDPQDNHRDKNQQDRSRFTLPAHDSSLSGMWCENIMSKSSRKRPRCSSSDSLDIPPSVEDSENSTTAQLAVRLYLCRADAEVATEGFTEKAMNSLLSAYNTLIDHRGSLTPETSRSSQETASKRRRIDLHTDSHQTDGHSGSDPLSSWSELMVKVASRMAKLSLKRKKLSSVVNSCHLLLQLDPGNLSAHYINTLVLKERESQRDKAVLAWLKERGIEADDKSKKNLEKLVADKQQTLKKMHSEKSSPISKWWQVSDLHLVSLDLSCMHHVLGVEGTTSQTDRTQDESFLGIQS